MVKCQDKEIQHTNSVLKLQGESHIVPVGGAKHLVTECTCTCTNKPRQNKADSNVKQRMSQTSTRLYYIEKLLINY